MRTSALTKLLSFASFIAVLFTASAALETNGIEEITGLKGTWSAAEGVFKITAPRNDVKENVDGWTMKEEAMVMGARRHC